MVYVLIISSFVLCTSLLVTGRLNPNFERQLKDSALPNWNDRHVGNGTNFFESNSAKTNSRQRRSMLAALVDHIAGAAEKFQMKPVLVESINDVEGCNNKLKSKLSERSKSINAMLSEGAEGNKEVQQSDSKVSTKEAKVSINKEKEENTKKWSKTYSKIILAKLESLNDYFEDIINIERKLMKQIATYEWDSLSVEDIAHLYLEGVCNTKSEQILKPIVDKHPMAKKQLMEGARKIKKIRKIAHRRYKLISLRIGFHKLYDHHAYLYDEVEAADEHNEKWLAYNIRYVNQPPLKRNKEPTKQPINENTTR